MRGLECGHPSLPFTDEPRPRGETAQPHTAQGAEPTPGHRCRWAGSREGWGTLTPRQKLSPVDGEGEGMGDCENRCDLRGLRELPVSQRGPSKGSVHRQVKFPTRSTHVPPFRHGPEPHSSTSGAAEKGLGCSQPLAPSHPPRPVALGGTHLSRRPCPCSQLGTRTLQSRPPPGTGRRAHTPW